MNDFSLSIKNLASSAGGHLRELQLAVGTIPEEYDWMGLMWVFVSLLLMDAGIAYIPTLAISTVTNFLVIRAVYTYWARKS